MPYLICGVDEVGRGALAGPMMAVATLFRASGELPDVDKVNWSSGCPVEGVKDSKAFSSSKKRELIYSSVLRCPDLIDFGIGEVSVDEINQMGIEKANSYAFFRAVKDLKEAPNYILVDGDEKMPAWDWGLQQNRPKADSLWWPVSAASILAKVIRDRYMAELGQDFQYYGWRNNSGYGTKEHTEAIVKYGPCVHHRTKFIQGIMKRGSC